MTTMAPPIITCPVCGADGSMLHHDLRSSLVYSCLRCTHEWQIDPTVATAADLESACGEGHSDGDAEALSVAGDAPDTRGSLMRDDDE
jgi:hypothetical protein